MTKENPVIVERKKILDEVCRGIIQSKYYSILGPKQIGKTTFLKYVKNRIETEEGKNFKCVHLDLGNLKTANPGIFYSDLVCKVSKELNIDLTGKIDSKESFNDFLISLLKSSKENIILLLDEIEHIPEYITKELLELFRTYHQARERESFYERLSVIISGSTNLLEFTMGGLNSPFNIADPILLSDLDHADGCSLIDKIMSKHQARIEPLAKEKILEETNGHPYLISRLCVLSVESASDKIVRDNIIIESIDRLIVNYRDDDFFSFIIRKVESDLDIFETLVEILDKGFARQKEPGITIGKYELSGAFLKDKNVFKVRNNIINKLFTDYFDYVRCGDIFVMLGKWEKALEFYKREEHADRMKRRREDTITITRKRRIDIIKAIGNMMFLPQKSTEAIYEYLMDGIYYALSYDSVYIYSVNKKENCLNLKNCRGSISVNERIQIEEYSQTLEIRAYNARKSIVEDQNEQNNFAVAFPLLVEDDSVNWILSINNYKSGIQINNYDCEGLKIFINEAVLALKNARTYYDLYKEKQAILEAVGEEISIIDNEFNILYMNRVKIDRIGKDYSNTKEKCYNIFITKNAPCTGCPCMEAMKKGVIIRNNNYSEELDKDYKKRFVIQTASPLKDEDGNFSKAINIVRNVTKQKILFDIIEKLQKELDLNKLITIIMDEIVQLGYKRVRFYDYVKKDKSEFVIGRVSRGMEACGIEFSGYRIDLKDANYIMPTLTHKKPDFYFGNINDPGLKNCKWLRDLQLENVKWMDLPLVSGQELIGFIGIDNKNAGEEFTNEDLNIMAILAGYAAQAIVNSSYISRQKILYDISKKLSGTLEIGELQKEIVKTICEVLQTEMCSIFLYDEKKKLLILESNYALTQKDWTHNIDFKELYELGTYICGRVYEEGTPRIIDDIEEFLGAKNNQYIQQHERHLKSEKVKNVIFAPITYKIDKIGIIRVANKLDEKFNLSEIGFKQDDLDLLVSLGEQIAIALANSRLYQEKSIQLEGLVALNRVISMITAAANLDEIYKTVEEIKNIFPNIDEMCLLEKKENGDFLPVFGCPNRDTPDCIRCKEMERACIKKGETYEAYYCDNVEKYLYFEKALRKDLKSRFVIPLVFKNDLLGIFDIGSKNINAFSEFDGNLFRSLGSQIAIAINNHIKQRKQMEIYKDISHSLGTYLTTMRGYTQRLIKGEIKTELKKQEYLKRLFTDVLFLTNSVDAISSLAHMEYGEMTFEETRVEINDIIESIANKNDFLLNEKRLVLKITGTEEKVSVIGDKYKLEEAIQSLMNNAIKFTKENKTIYISIVTESNVVLIKIQDKGIGIHEDDLERIFKKYERGRNAKDQKIEGTGIGLTTAKNIIEKHGGTITVESRLGVGSTFTIKLPFLIKEDTK
ncbi:MAG: GAF domain-containing protein [Candidatus Aminicenantes bacterium]|nr:GAF domain-containing protein [Candidatus Aminicenantes bacterium]